MNTGGEDNHSVRQTKRKLNAALTHLMLQKPVHQITVRELAKEAGVSRGTFYFHYADIYALLDELENTYFAHLEAAMQQMAPALDGQEPPPALLALFRYLHENSELCRALCGANGRPVFMGKIKQLVVYKCIANLYSRRAATKDAQWEYLAAFAFEGCIGVVRAWQARTPREKPETVARTVWCAAVGAVQAMG